MNVHSSTQASINDLSTTLNSRLSVYLINLDRSPERRFRMEARVLNRGLDFERISALDGREITMPLSTFDEAARPKAEPFRDRVFPQPCRMGVENAEF